MAGVITRNAEAIVDFTLEKTLAIVFVEPLLREVRNPVCRSETSKPSILVIPVGGGNGTVGTIRVLGEESLTVLIVPTVLYSLDYSSPRAMSRSTSRCFSFSFLSWAFRPRHKPKRSLM